MYGAILHQLSHFKCFEQWSLQSNKYPNQQISPAWALFVLCQVPLILQPSSTYGPSFTAVWMDFWDFCSRLDIDGCTEVMWNLHSYITIHRYLILVSFATIFTCDNFLMTMFWRFVVSLLVYLTLYFRGLPQEPSS